MKFLIIFLLFSNNFIFSMENQEKQTFITKKILKEFYNLCENKNKSKNKDKNWVNFFNSGSRSNCGHVFVTEKFLIEYKEDSLESTIYFKKPELGKIKNSVPIKENSLRTRLLNYLVAIKNTENIVGDILVDSKTVCKNPFYPANGDNGWIKCHTLLNSKNK